MAESESPGRRIPELKRLHSRFHVSPRLILFGIMTPAFRGSGKPWTGEQLRDVCPRSPKHPAVPRKPRPGNQSHPRSLATRVNLDQQYLGAALLGKLFARAQANPPKLLANAQLDMLTQLTEQQTQYACSTEVCASCTLKKLSETSNPLATASMRRPRGLP